MAKPQADMSSMQQLKQDIRDKNPANLYMFYGEEAFLLQHYLNQLKRLLVDELTESFNFHKLNSESFGIQEFADSVENLPMMAEHTMVLVDEVDIFKLPEADREKLSQIIEDIPDYCTVVFSFANPTWKPDTRMKKLWNAFKSNGQVVEFCKQSQRDLTTWITRHFAANQKTITPDLCVYLLEITDGTMTSLAGEISKISAFSSAQQITRSDIDAVTEPVLDAVVFKMTDQLGDGEYGAALTTVQKLLKMQQEPIAILGAIGGHFRRMATARVLLDAGRNYGELMSLYGISDYAAKKAMNSAKRFSTTFYSAAASLILETDRQMKTSYDDPKRLLEVLIVQLAQEARNA